MLFTLLTLTLLLTGCVILLRSEAVQTSLTQELAAYYSSKLHTKVTVGEVDVEFFKKLVLRDVYIQDQHQDTLLFFNELKMDITKLSFKKHLLDVSELELVNPVAKLVKYKSEQNFNYQFLVNLFSADTAKSDTSMWTLKCQNVLLNNVTFVYKDENDTDKTNGMNYFDLLCKKVNGELKNIHFQKDTLYFGIENLSAHEKCGFFLKKMTADISLSSVLISASKLDIETESTHITGDYKMKYKQYSDFLDYNHKVKMISHMNNARVDINDVAYFAPALKGVKETVLFSGDVNGTVDNLKTKNMKIHWASSTYFEGNMDLTGLPDVDNFVMNLNVKELTTTKSDLDKFPLYPFSDGNKLQLPANISSLGFISFKGKFTGFLNDFVAYGQFSSALGSVSTDLAMKENMDQKRLYYNGKIKSTGFNLGKLMMVKQIGIVALDADIDGSGVESDKLDAKLDGTILRFDAMGYSYKDAKVQARLTKKIFDGLLTVNEENLKLDFKGNIDLSQKLPLLNFDATIDRANLTALHLVKNGKAISLSSQLSFKMRGNSIDNLTGLVDICNTKVNVDTARYNFGCLNISAVDDKKNKQLKISSDFIDCEIAGKYMIHELPESLENLLNGVMPAYMSSHIIKSPQEQQFEVNATFKKTSDFTRLFLPAYEIANGTSVKGSFNSASQKMNVEVNSPQFSVYGKKIVNAKFNAVLENKKLTLKMNSDLVGVTDSVMLKNFEVASSTQNDSSLLTITWDNKSTPIYKADIKTKIVFGSAPDFKFGFMPSEVVIADSVWNINALNQCTIDSSCFYVHNMVFSHNNQVISLSGNSSIHPGDSMVVDFSQFNLADLNRLFISSGVKLKGIINGKTILAGLYSTPMIISNTNFTDLKFNDEIIGNGYVKTVWNSEKEALSLNGLFNKELIPNIVFSGFYYPKRNDSININMTLSQLSLDLFRPYIKDYCKDFVGEFSGNITATGIISKPELRGKLTVDARKITIDYLGTSYSCKHDIIVEPNSFSVEDMIVYDQIYEQNKKNNTLSEKDKKIGSGTAVVRGRVYHDNFKNFQFDIDIVPRKFMVLNTFEGSNNLYYGQAYVSGKYINIFGFLSKEILISADIKTDKVNIAKKSGITKIFIPLSGPSEVASSDFITFVNHDSTVVRKNKYKVDLSGLQLDFDLDVTPDAEVQMIFDQKVGDVIKTRGNGSIKMDINSLGKFNMYGNYTIENGDYLFTLQNVINKRFDIEQGGTIKWSGDPYDADINLNAVYKLRTALSPLFPGDSTGIYKHRYPVDCKLLLRNKLMSPDFTFDIDLPSVNEGTRRDVRTMVNSDLEINRQVFSLMVLGGFVTPQSLAGGTTDASNAGKVASSELLSNQLSNMLSKISKDFDLGVKYRSGDKVSNEELQVALSTQLFNNRLEVDGNVGVSSSVVQNTNTLVGDFNLEYKLTDDGKIRVKAFNRTNDNAITTLTSPYTQGLGVFYREEFNTIGELYRRYLSRVKKNKKQEEPAN